MMKNIKSLILSSTILISSISVSAQCPVENQAFKSGEFLTYNLYYNWKFIWVKAGTASMSTVLSRYKGKPAYRASLITRGNHRVDDYFVLRDTLLCYSREDMVPLYYRKGAREGKRYTVDEIWYSYLNGNSYLRQHRLNNDGKNEWKNSQYKNCIYDMMNIFLCARSYNPASWQIGHSVNIPLADGNNVTPAILKYRGKTVIKADNGVKYRCLTLSYIEKDDNKMKEIVRFFITDDENHIPVRLDMFLRFGSAKAFLTNFKGIKNPISSRVN
jgi:hypothetical protein